MRTLDGVQTRPAQPTDDAEASRSATWTGRLRLVVMFLVGVALLTIATSIAILWGTDSFAEPSIVIDDPLVNATIVVAIDGAVATPGLYELPGGSRVQHVVDAAGGVLPNADLAAINPALRIADGERIVIPSLANTPVPPTASGAPTPPVATMGLVAAPNTPAPPTVAAGDGRIDINSASQAELETLPGIGPAKAAAIIVYRDDNGQFSSVDELEDVEGISAAMVADLAPLVFVGP